MEHFGFQEMKALQSLLSTEDKDSDSDGEVDQKTKYKLGPGHIGPPKPSKSEETAGRVPLKADGDDIWHQSEVTTAQTTQLFDPRDQPEYEIKFKQAVTTEDVFLGMSFKTPSSASCEWLTVLIKMPGEIKEKIDLEVESDAVDVRSPRYRLHLPTPQPIDPNASSAKWNATTSTLELNLRMSRELDPLNF